METTNESRGRSINRSLIIAAVTGMLLWAAADVFAQGSGSCTEDAAKFCKDVQPGEGGIVQCLRDHDRELSALCRDKVKVVMQRVEEAKHICAKDIEKFCAGVKPGGGRLIKCLNPHMDELTPACREKLQSFTAKASAARSGRSAGRICFRACGRAEGSRVRLRSRFPWHSPSSVR